MALAHGAARGIRVGAFAVIAAALLGGLLWVDPERVIAGFLSDDAFYYLKIARHIAEGRGSTFDGLHPTNGYHPLWMLVVVAVTALAPAGLVPPALAVIVLSVGMGLATLALVARVVGRYLAPGLAAVGVAACLLPIALIGMTNGLETGILMLSLAVWAWASLAGGLHRPGAGPGAAFWFGLLLGVVFLARLDSAFLVITAGGLLAASGLIAGQGPARILARLSAVGAGGAVAALPYFAWNLLRFGHLAPISGAVKSSFPELRHHLDLRGDMEVGALLTAAVLVLNAWTLAGDRRRGVPLAESLASPVLMLGTACALHFLHAWLFLDWGVYWWHFAATNLAFALALPVPLARWLEARPRLRPLAVGLLVAGFASLGGAVKVLDFAHKGRQHGGWMEAARWARQHTPPDAVFAIVDAGLFGYFSDRRVINLDGKANGYGYREEIERDGLEAYLRRTGVAYLADIHCRYVDGACAIAVQRVNDSPLLLVLNERDEVFRSAPIPERKLGLRASADTHFVIWRFEANDPPVGG